MFRFENITCLYALPLVLVMAVLVYVLMQRKKSQLAKVGDSDLLDRLMSERSTRKEWIKYGLWLLGLTFLILACSNPQWGTKKEKVKATSADIYIALDISRSMDAKDISPSRLERSKKFVEELINTLKGDRIGLISFAGSAYLQIPLTSVVTFAVGVGTTEGAMIPIMDRGRETYKKDDEGAAVNKREM